MNLQRDILLNSIALFLFVIAPTKSLAFMESIYGDDDRVEIQNLQHAPDEVIEQELAKSVFLMSSRQELTYHPELHAYAINQKEFEEPSGTIDKMRFANEQRAGNCTGFLISETRMITAGHCVYPDMISDLLVVTDYRSSPKNGLISEETVHTAKRIIAQGYDFAVIELSAPITDRAPLKLAGPNQGGVISESIFIIGHPYGWPQIIAGNAQILRKDQALLITNLDSFSGNSGSPVFDQITKAVIGILISGQSDETVEVQGDQRIVSDAVYPNTPDTGGETVLPIQVVTER